MGTVAKVLGALAVAGVAASGGTAFTGAGMAAGGTAASAQFIGGTVSQTVTGGTLSSVVYGFSDGATGKINSVTLTFNDAVVAGKIPTITATGATLGQGATPTTHFTCEAVGATNAHESTCLPKGAAEAAPSEAWMSGLSALNVTVPQD